MIEKQLLQGISSSALPITDVEGSTPWYRNGGRAANLTIFAAIAIATLSHRTNTAVYTSAGSAGLN